ncbi:DsbA family protein [Paenibacillus solisilvae]|uniref:DsbA family protein n=1 Tax=Paenibacillus solisilvae TaxID=2486751 RepID=A0ABW0VTK2_9BACL
MAQATKKSEYKSLRKIQQIQQEKQRKRMKQLFWITGIVVAALIIVAVIFAPKPGVVSFNYDELPTLGKTDAPIKIVEFGDYKCPSCKIFSQEIEPQLKKDYIDNGTVSLSFMNFTIIDPDSVTAALAAQSIYHQNNEAFWGFYDSIYKNQGQEHVTWATPEFLTNLAKQEKLDVDYDKLNSDITSAKYQSEVDSHNSKARQLNVQSTPTLFINGVMFEDVFDYEALKKAIEQAQKDLK